MTPTWLEAHASYIDSSRTSTPQQLTFNAGAKHNAALLKVPMIPSDILKAGTPLTVEITVAHDVSISGGKLIDSDIRYVVSDGTRFVGFETNDKGNFKTMHPAMELKGFQVRVLLPCNKIWFFPHPTTPSTLDSLSLLSSWMNAGARATFRMTEVSSGPPVTTIV